MNKRLYTKTFLLISMAFFLITLIGLISFVIFLPEHSLLPIVLVSFSTYACSVILFSIFYYRYSPVFQTSQKTSTLNKILYDLVHKSVFLTERDDLYSLILESAISAIPSAQKGCILLLDSKTNLLHFASCVGYDFETLKETYLKLDQSYLYRESKGKVDHTVIINDPFGYDRKLHDKNIEKILEAGTDNVITTLSTPVIYNDTLYGMINIDSKFINAYTSDDVNIIEHFALEIANVIKLFLSMEKANYFMNHDVLTNAINRKHFNEILEKKLTKDSIHNSIFTLVSMDLNDLKKANDEKGHECGDKLLIEFSNGFLNALPEKSYFSRYGGDEFQLLLPDYTLERTLVFMEEIQHFFEIHPLNFHGTIIPISFSYGIVSYPDDYSSFDDLVRLADNRMYENKRNYHQLMS